MDIQKKKNEIIRIERKSYNDFKYIDMRIFFLGDQDKWLPTKKGVTFSPNLINEVIDTLKKVSHEITDLKENQ